MRRAVLIMTWVLSSSIAMGQGYLVTTLTNRSLMPSSDLGSQLALTIDVDLDGIDDLAAATTSGAVVLLSGVDLSVVGRLEGLDPAELYGFDVADLGDVDGDGFRDLGIGIPGRADGTGAVEIRSMKTDTVLRTIVGSEFGSGFGVVVRAVDDLDGDGRRDIAISAPFFTSGSPAPIGQVSLHSTTTGLATLTLSGASSVPGFGLDIAPAGFVDGDTTPDILLLTEGTSAKVISGATGATLRTYGLASSVECLGDVNSDGVDDHLIGTSNGQAVVFSGATGLQLFAAPAPDARVVEIGDLTGDGILDFATLDLRADLLDPAVATLHSGLDGSVIDTIAPNSTISFPVSALGRGDLDGDGFADVFVGVSGSVNSSDGGSVRRWSNGISTHTADGISIVDRFGAALGLLDDVDGDGIADLAVGANASQIGGVRIAGQVDVHSGADLSVIHSIPGQTFAALGANLTGTGDLNGDGVGDLFATAQGFLAPYDGIAISGSDGSTIWQASAPTMETPQQCAAVGDFSDDAIADVIVVYRDPTSSSGPVLRLHSGADGSLQIAPIFTGSTSATTILNVLGIPDVDGDGEEDFAAAAGDSANGDGLIQLFSSATLAPLWTVTGTNQERLGSSLALAGDWNGDGTHDVLAGQPFAPMSPGGAVRSGGALILSGVDGSILESISGDVANERAGRSVALFEDLDGDGFGEVVLTSTPGPAGSTERRLRVASPMTGRTFFERSYLLAAGNSDLQILPTSDIDADGLAELFIGIADELNIGGRVEVLAAVGQSAGTSTFGTGCSTLTTTEPLITTYGGEPTSAGNTDFGVALTNAPPTTVATLLVGLSNTAWPLGALPFDLSPFGYPGCAILTSSEQSTMRATSPTLTGRGAAFVDIPIPASAALSGFTFHAQWFVPEVSSTNLPAVMTSGLTVTVQ